MMSHGRQLYILIEDVLQFCELCSPWMSRDTSEAYVRGKITTVGITWETEARSRCLRCDLSINYQAQAINSLSSLLQML